MQRVGNNLEFTSAREYERTSFIYHEIVEWRKNKVALYGWRSNCTKHDEVKPQAKIEFMIENFVEYWVCQTSFLVREYLASCNKTRADFVANEARNFRSLIPDRRTVSPRIFIAAVQNDAL